MQVSGRQALCKPSDIDTARKIRSLNKGRMAETMTGLYLRLCGYRILGRNVRTPLGEIDIIARRGHVLRFVEVKARPNLDTAMQAVTRRQQLRIINASQYFIGQRDDLNACEPRYDVALMIGTLRFRYLKDAWRCDGF